MPGTWQQLRDSPGGGVLGYFGFAASTMLLLTDGTIICQREGSTEWKRLVPDRRGSYLNGTWHDMPRCNNARMYYASAVLADGRVILAGGESSEGFLPGAAQVEQDTVEIFDPVSGNWEPKSTPGWGSLGDAPAWTRVESSQSTLSCSRAS